LVIDWESRSEIASTTLKSSSPEGFLLWAHPSGQGVVIDAGRGQDGTDLWTACLGPDSLAIHQLARDDQAFGGGFLSDGTLLALPHTGDTVSIYSWPNLSELGHLANRDLFVAPLAEGGDGFYWDGFPIEDRYLLLMTIQGRLVLVDHRKWRAVAEVRIPGYEWRSAIGSMDVDPDLSSVRQIAGNRFEADHEQIVDRTIWAVPLS
jgi:hypothetical protein